MMSASARSLLLVALTATHAAHLPPPTAGSRIARGALLHLRGGQIDALDETEDEVAAADAPSPRGLNREEIVSKLNEVPTFCVTNEEGGVCMFRMRNEDASGKVRHSAAVCFFLEPDEAKSAMEQMQKAMPSTTLKLTMHTLASAFEHCRGWQSIAKSTFASEEADMAATDAADEPQPTTPQGEPIEMRLMGNRALVNSTGAEALKMLHDHNIDPGCWQLPVFLCNELQSKSIVPAFLRPSDLKKTWLAAGRTEETIPQDVMVIDLRLLVAQMQTGSNDWTRLHIVPAEDAVELAFELQGKPPPDAE